jgi:hypothetical protein
LEVANERNFKRFHARHPIPEPTFILSCPSLCFALLLWARRSASVVGAPLCVATYGLVLSAGFFNAPSRRARIMAIS